MLEHYVLDFLFVCLTLTAFHTNMPLLALESYLCLTDI